MTARCEFCGGPMIRFHDDQRFCCRAHSDAWFQAERREAVAYFRAAGMRPTLDAQQMEVVSDQRKAS
jgi:hypothetical protein